MADNSLPKKNKWKEHWLCHERKMRRCSKLAQEAEQLALQMVVDASERDAELVKAEEDKVAELLSESRRTANELVDRENSARDDAIWLVNHEDAETVAQMQAQVAGMPTQDTEAFRENIERLGMGEMEIPSNDDCLYVAVNTSVYGTAVDSSMTSRSGQMGRHSAGMALILRRGENDKTEAERCSQQGRLVTHEEIQPTATALRCRIVIYHARPGHGEPDMAHGSSRG